MSDSGTGAIGLGLRLCLVVFGLTQIQASCSYAPPPLPSSGQGADTLAHGRVAAGVEAGHGTSASWWNASNLADVDVNSKWVGGLRLRRGMGDIPCRFRDRRRRGS